METFYSGSLKIEIEEDGTTPDNRERVKGTIITQDGRRWEFTDLASGCGGSRHGLIEMAASAITFGSNYTTHNRGEDTPEWAPPAELADAIDNERDHSPDPVPAGFPARGETDEDGTIYHGDSALVFDSLEWQAHWYAVMNGEVAP
jgi:hypothetical protein